MIVRKVNQRLYQIADLVHALEHRNYYILMFETHLQKHMKYRTSLGLYLTYNVLGRNTSHRLVKCSHCYAVIFALKLGQLVKELYLVNYQLAIVLYKRFISEQLNEDLQQDYIENLDDEIPDLV